jgi:hypothetical protein
MSPPSKKERHETYEQAVREASAAYAAHVDALALHPELVLRFDKATVNFNIIEANMEEGSDYTEFHAANEEWEKARNEMDAATMTTLTVLMSTQLRVNETYEDYMA